MFYIDNNIHLTKSSEIPVVILMTIWQTLFNVPDSLLFIYAYSNQACTFFNPTRMFIANYSNGFNTGNVIYFFKIAVHAVRFALCEINRMRINTIE